MQVYFFIFVPKVERLVLYPAKMRNCIITALLEKVEYDKVVQKSLNICKNYTDLEFWPQSSNTHTIIQFVLLKKFALLAILFHKCTVSITWQIFQLYKMLGHLERSCKLFHHKAEFLLDCFQCWSEKKFFSLILKSQFYLKTFLLRLHSKFTNKYSLNCSL